MSRWAPQLACALALILTGIGCGTGESTQANRSAQAARSGDVVPAVPAGADEAQIALLGLIPPRAIPYRVTGRRSERNRARCGPRVLFRHVATAMATSPRYEVEGGRVQQTVSLFRTDAAAARAFKRLSSTSVRRCVERYVRAKAREQVQAQVGPPVERILNLEPHGQQTTAYRTEVATNVTSVAVDVLLNRVGRSLSSVSLIWSAPPSDLAFQEQLTATIAARLRGVVPDTVAPRRGAGHHRPM